MHMYLDFGLFKVPGYGTMILTGIFIANIIVILLIALGVAGYFLYRYINKTLIL